MTSSAIRRFTISVTREMEQDLDLAKREVYYKTSQNAMIRDLILRGLAALEEERRQQDGDPAGRETLV